MYLDGFHIPLILILTLFFGIDGVLYAGPVADGVAFVVSVVLISLEMKKMRRMERSLS